MIYFNATFFVQIVHFLFAWWLLRRFLFRTVVNAIQNEKSISSRLNNTLASEKDLLAQSQKELERQWAWYQQQFKKRVPESVMHSVITTRSFKKIEAPDLSESDQKKQCKLLTEVIVTRLSDD